MAFPTDPPDPGANASASGHGHLTLDDAERLAAAFRPSWELDDAPFTGAASLTDADLRALKGIEGAADVRGAVQALNGTHAPAPATVLLREEPTSSVIVDGAIAAEVAHATSSSVPPQAMAEPPMQPAPLAEAAIPAPVAVAQRTLVMMNAPSIAIPLQRRPTPSLDLGEVDFAKRSKSRLWIAVGVGAVAVLGLVIWLASGSGDKRAAPLPPVETVQATTRSRIPPPPPPIETAAVQAPSPAIPPPPTAPAAPPPPPPVVAAVPEKPVAAPPPQPPAPRLAVPPAPRPPTWTPPPRPAARPKAGQTIVRDVPF